MLSNIVFLKPYLKPTIWGGVHLKKYGVQSKNKIGEAWLVSAINQHESKIKGTNINLSTFFKTHPAFFNHTPYHTYPLLLKLLDCNDNLSIQVHPQDKQLQKNEAWYFLHTNKNTKVICGHKARSKDDFMQKYNARAWNKLLAYTPIKKEDIVYIPTGTIHALLKGVVVLEIQQPSDTTYRLYDYDRELVDPQRKLHVKEALANINYFSQSIKPITNGHLSTPYFTIDVINNIKTKSYSFKADWLQCFVVDGRGTINNVNIKRGDCFLLSHKWTKFTIIGKIKTVFTYIKTKNG